MVPLSTVIWTALLAVATVKAAALPPDAEDTIETDARTAEIAAWTKEYAARRAGYYLADARKMLDKALKHHAARLKGKDGPDPYLKVWDAQSQLAAALSWDNESAELWLEAGNLTFSLAGLMREIEEGDFLDDALAFWAQALRLELQSMAGATKRPREGPLAVKLKSWLEDLRKLPASDLKKRFPQRLWLRVREDAWREVKNWDTSDAGQPPRRGVHQRLPGRVARVAAQGARRGSPTDSSQCATTASHPTSTASSDSGWLSDKIGNGRETVFPTYIFRANLLEELGAPLFERLSSVAAAKYSEFRKDHIRRHGGYEAETMINDAFFQFQETHETNLRSPDGRSRWPELYGLEEFEKLLVVARNASLAFLQHSGVQVSSDELRSSWIIIWTAVYPQDPSTNSRHGWHTHQESIVSGVMYANPRGTPLLFADPRGAPPIEDYEQYRANDLLYEPKAPFDANYHVFAEQGDIVLFPSWLVHKVPPVLGKGGSGTRVVFPFNFHLGTGKSNRGTVWDGWERTVPVV